MPESKDESVAFWHIAALQILSKCALLCCSNVILLLLYVLIGAKCVDFSTISIFVNRLPDAPQGITVSAAGGDTEKVAQTKSQPGLEPLNHRVLLVGQG